MTKMEARDAFKQGCPVIHSGIEYLYISAIIYRRGGPEGFFMQVELLDRSKKAVVIADPRRVKAKE